MGVPRSQLRLRGGYSRRLHRDLRSVPRSWLVDCIGVGLRPLRISEGHGTAPLRSTAPVVHAPDKQNAKLFHFQFNDTKVLINIIQFMTHNWFVFVQRVSVASCAAWEGHEAVVRLLLDHDADPHAEITSGYLKCAARLFG